MSINFTRWSDEFKSAREWDATVTAGAVLALFQRRIPGNWKRTNWAGAAGFRKNTDEAGEKAIEKDLLGAQPVLLRGLKRPYELHLFRHNHACSRIARGQVIADIFGVVVVGKNPHPLIVEVKDNANDCWFALVENLQQIKMARANEKNLKELIRKARDFCPLIADAEARGTWGLVVAPKAYFDRRLDLMAASTGLLKLLKEKTRARVAFASYDKGKFKEDRTLDMIVSNWE